MRYHHVLEESDCGNRERCVSPPQDPVEFTEPKKWTCPICKVLNTKYRSYCHECGRERTEED